jgi:hypothetical protein
MNNKRKMKKKKIKIWWNSMENPSGPGLFFLGNSLLLFIV